MSSLTAGQKLGVAIAQKCASSLSIGGSSYILQAVLKDKRKRSKVFYRLLASMSLTDVVCSIWMFLGTWAVPQGTPGYHNPVGTPATCQAQAFFIWFSVTTLNFNACIALYYLLSIKYEWKEHHIRQSIEIYFYLYAIGVGLGVALPGLFLGYYGPANYWCSSQPIAGSKHAYLIWYIPAWVVLVFVTLAMAAIYLHVRQTEKKAERYDFCRYKNSTCTSATLKTSSTRRLAESSATLQLKRQQEERKHSRQVAAQAFYYCLAFYLTLAFPTTARTMQATKGQTPYAILLLHSFFLPAQGFMNFLVYMRQRWAYKLAAYPRVKVLCCYLCSCFNGSSANSHNNNNGNSNTAEWQHTNNNNNNSNSNGEFPSREDLASHNEILGYYDDEEEGDEDEENKLQIPCQSNTLACSNKETAEMEHAPSTNESGFLSLGQADNAEDNDNGKNNHHDTKDVSAPQQV